MAKIQHKMGGRYQIADELGRGAMGVVYLAEDLLLERQVAVKVLGERHEEQSESLARFHREARLAARLEHPSIVPIYDFGSDEEGLYIVMPLLRGETLRLLIQRGQLTRADVLEIVVRTARALDYSHSRGIVHRDVKPENIMILREDDGPQKIRQSPGDTLQIKVMDFGVAAAQFERTVTQTGQLIGTLCYASPEQITGEPIDGRSDVYSLGSILYETVTGSPPFTGSLASLVYKVLDTPPVPPRQAGADVDEPFESLILQCLAKDPCERPPTAEALAKALESYQAGQDPQILLRSSLSGPRNPGEPAENRPDLSEPLFVGREAQLRQLREAYESSLEGHCHLILIGGEAGVGKTRLLNAFEKELRPRAARVLHGRFVERQDRSFLYQGFCDIIAEAVTRRPGEARSLDAPPVDLSEMAADLACLFPALSEIPALREMAESYRKETVAAREADATISGENRSTFELLSRTISAISEGRALVLTFENLHHANESVDAIHYVYRRLMTLPILILGTYRSTELDESHPLAKLLDVVRGYSRARVMTLEPFSTAEHSSYLSAILGAGISSDLLATSYEVTEGNPYYAFEYVRTLIEEGDVERDESGHWLMKTRPRGPERIPAAIRHTVERRIEGLADEDREVLAIASVLGRRFEYEDLELLAERDVDEPCDRLMRNGYFEVPVSSQGDEIAFASVLVREVVYESLSFPKRRRLHRKYARDVETRFASSLDTVAQHLAHHFKAGNQPEEAVHYALRAARKSFQEMELEAAVRSAKTVLKFVDSPKWREGARPEAEARLLLAKTYREWGTHDEAVEEAALATAAFARENDLQAATAAAALAAETAWENRDVARAQHWFRQGRRWARESGSSEQLVKILRLGEAIANYQEDFKKAQSYRRESAAVLDGTARSDEESATEETPARLGDLLFVRGEYEAARKAYKAAREKRLANGQLDLFMEAAYLLKMGELTHKMGDYDQALAHGLNGISLAETIDPLITARLESFAAMVCCSAGKTRQAEGWIERGFERLGAAAASDETKRREAEASLHRARGNFLFDTGSPHAAIESYDRSLELWRFAGDVWEESIALFNLGETTASVGRFQDALGYLDEAAQLKSQLGDRWGLAYVHLVDARIRLGRGRVEEALEQAQSGLELASRIGDPKLGALLHVALGRAHLAAHDIGRAETEFHRAHRSAREAQAHLVVIQARIGLARSNLERGRFTLAQRHAEEAREEASSRGAKEELTAALITLGDLERRLGSFEQSAEMFRQALDLAGTAGNYSHEHEVLFSWARLNLERSDPEAARPQLEKILERAQKTGDRYHQGAALLILAEVHQQLRDPRRAQKAAEAALESFRESPERQAEAAVYSLLSRHHLKVDTAQAVGYARQAVEMLEREGENAFRMLGHAYLDLGRAHRGSGTPRAEVEAFELARYYFSSAGDLSGLADSFRAMAITSVRDDPDKAEELLRKGLRLTQEIGYRRGEAEAFGDLGEIARRRGRLAEAGEAFLAEKRVIERTGYLRRNSINAYHLASLELLYGRLHEASRLSEECLEMAERIGDRARFFGHEIRGRVALELGRYSDASAALQDALGYAEALSNETMTANARLSRARLFLDLGLLDRAGDEVKKGLRCAPRLPGEESSLSSGYLVRERLQLAALRVATEQGQDSERGESLLHRLIETFEQGRTPIEEIEARLVWVDCLIAAGRLAQAEEQAAQLGSRSKDLGLEVMRCDALFHLAVLRRDTALAEEVREAARALPSPRRVVESLRLLVELDRQEDRPGAAALSAGELDERLEELAATVPAELRPRAVEHWTRSRLGPASNRRRDESAGGSSGALLKPAL